MDWQLTTLKMFQSLVRDRRGRGLIIAVLIAACLVALQFNGQQQQPMCDLISGCPLRNSDLQRIQLALGQSGLSDFQVDGQRVLVPRLRHADYLQAVADKNALPMDLREQCSDATGTNPFLSRSQQLALERAARKRQIRQMILRLPFVEQAWFEMDTANSGSPFKPIRQSAVVSVRPAAGVAINGQHVDTIRRMICGALAGIDPEQIAVIDVNDGFAWHDPATGSGAPLVDSGRRLLEQQRYLENQIRHALQRFDGIGVSVQLTPDQLNWNQPVNAGPAASQSDVPVHLTTAVTKVKHSLAAGSNGAASIHQIAANRKPIQADSRLSVAPKQTQSQKYRVSVAVEVPSSALKNIALASSPLVRPVDPDQRQDTVQQKFESAKAEIVRTVTTMLPAELLRQSGTSPVNVSLIHNGQPLVVDWRQQLQQAFEQHWPSVATLVIGLMLLVVVTRKPVEEKQAQATANDAVVLPMPQTSQTSNQVKTDPNDMDDDGPQARINRLIQKDPDAAARVIQDWMRDAA